MRFIPKFIRRIWCKHEGVIFAGPEVDELPYYDEHYGMTQFTELICSDCNKKRTVELRDLWRTENPADLLR